MCTLEMAMQLVQKCRLRTHVLLVHSVGITCMYKDSRSKPIICFVLVMVESSTLFLHNNLWHVLTTMHSIYHFDVVWDLADCTAAGTESKV